MPDADQPPLLQRLRRDALHRAVAFFAMLLLFGGMLVASFVVTPDDIESGTVTLSPRCLSLRLFGRRCPSCGMTRAFTAISHGQLERGLQHNPAAGPAYLLCWMLALWGAGGSVRSARQSYRLKRGAHRTFPATPRRRAA